MAGLFGWMFSMGIVWWIYGIGLNGADPSWMEREINFDRNAVAITEQLNDLPATDDLTSSVRRSWPTSSEDNPDIRGADRGHRGRGLRAEVARPRS